MPLKTEAKTAETPPPPAPRRSVALMLTIYVACMALLFRPRLESFDAIGYYSYVQSLVIHGHFDTRASFLAPVCNGHYDTCFYHNNPYGIGTSLFFAPFFLLAHWVVAPLLGAPRDGLSAPYIVLCGVGSSLYALAGLLLTWRVARGWFGDRTATLATITLWFASPLVFYMFPNNLYSHGADIFLNAAFLFLYVRDRAAPTRRSWFVWGAMVGLAMMVRMPNVFLAAAPLAESGYRLWRREADVREEIRRYALFAAGLFLALTPQMMVWKITRGSWLLLNPYHGATPDVTDWAHPKLLAVAFGSDRGFLLWAPAFLLGLIALPLLAQRVGRRLAAALTLLFALNYYLISCWSYYFGFGPRLFLNTVPLAILGMAGLVDWASRRRVPLRALRAASACFIVWTLLLMGQYVLKLVPNERSVDVAAAVRGQFTLIPDHMARLLHGVAGHRPPHP